MKTSYLRVIFLYVCLLAFAGVLVSRLYWLQIKNHEVYAAKADRQYTKPNHTAYNRGAIFFSTKDGTNISAATLKTGFVLAINPQKIGDAKSAYEKLSQILEISKPDFLAKAAKKNDPYEEIAKRVTQEDAEKITSLKIPGTVLFKDNWRFYPAGSLASQTLGLVGYQGSDYAGRYGLERSYEDTLKRTSDGGFANFFAQTFSNVKKTAAEGVSGDVITTIEPTVQDHLEKILASTTEKYSSKKSGGIIMDPKTGEVFAMAVYPSFDPNSPQSEKNSNIFSNALVENVYEMGSIIKPLTMAAGIDAGVVTPKSTYYDAGYLKVNGATISNFDFKGRGTVDMQEVLSQSLNTGVAYVQRKMGKESFARYMLGFGIGEKTGVDLPNEAAGLVKNLKSPREIEYATASFGQGIALTPVATIRALASLANGGKLVTPHIAKSIKYSIGLNKPVTFSDTKQVIKPETSKAVTEMLVNVVDDALAGGKYKNPRYLIAAKTGTAQIPNPAGGYYTDRYLHSFFGYLPASDPRFILFLFTIEPKGVKYASETLTTSFMDAANFLISYYEIAPDR